MIAAKRIGSFLVTGILWLFLGARLVADGIGYATLPDDAKVASKVGHQLILYVLATPWWAAFGAALIATIYLIHTSWPRTSSGKSPRKSDRYYGLGLEGLRFARRVDVYFSGNHSSHGENARDLLAAGYSLRISFEKSKITTPRFGDETDVDTMLNDMCLFYAATGTLLKDGHFKEAVAHARHIIKAKGLSPQ